ncbi:MAG: hypothetical protein IPG67_14425 [Acidobacteria bacterium]|nr:hypothetical protein [Acidobacteriota bacterium]
MKEHANSRTRTNTASSWWILPLIGAKAFGSEAGKKEVKKGADGGIDGMIVFTDDNSGKAKKVIVSVKGGDEHVAVSYDPNCLPSASIFPITAQPYPYTHWLPMFLTAVSAIQRE